MQDEDDGMGSDRNLNQVFRFLESLISCHPEALLIYISSFTLPALAVPRHFGPLQTLSGFFHFFCVSVATAGSQLQANCGEGQEMLMGHLAASVPA